MKWPASLTALLLAGVLVGITLAWLVFHPVPQPSTNLSSAPSEQLQSKSDVPPDRQPTPVTAAISTEPMAFQLRPFAVVRATESAEWTAEDGRDTNVIRRLAHNELEYARMVEENNRILRRQLVYRRDPAGMVVQRSKASGEPIQQLVLPGLDGRELKFEIERADLSSSGQSGSFQGHLAGQPDSRVTLAFKLGREAFSVSSPQDALYLEAEPREPGQVIIKEIDPDTYTTLPCGTPDFVEYEQTDSNDHNHGKPNP
jgi:hypothetical protein